MAGQWPDGRIVLLAALYSLGAHGIMTLNDFKSVEGDRRMGIRLATGVMLGVGNAALAGVLDDGGPATGRRGAAGDVGLSRARLGRAGPAAGADGADGPAAAPAARVWRPWYNGTGTTLYVIGMMVAAFALRAMVLVMKPGRSAGLGSCAWVSCRQALGADDGADDFHAQPGDGGRVVVAGVAARRAWWRCITRSRCLRPRLGYGSDMGGRRTPWIIGGMLALAAWRRGCGGRDMR